MLTTVLTAWGTHKKRPIVNVTGIKRERENEAQKDIYYTDKYYVARKMTQKRAFAALPEDAGSITSTHPWSSQLYHH